MRTHKFVGAEGCGMIVHISQYLHFHQTAILDLGSAHLTPSLEGCTL
jgi:hypothetical protein